LWDVLDVLDVLQALKIIFPLWVSRSGREAVVSESGLKKAAHRKNPV
jgi:hypothetical protein